MKDATKSREQLIGELATLRRRVAELEKLGAGRKRAEERVTKELTVISKRCG